MPPAWPFWDDQEFQDLLSVQEVTPSRRGDGGIWHGSGCSWHHTVFLQEQRAQDSDAKSLSPHGAWWELPATLGTGSESHFV